MTAPLQPEQGLSVEYVQGLLDDIQPEKWRMEYHSEEGLIIRGIEPIDGQLMLTADVFARAYLDQQAELTRLRSALAEAEAEVVTIAENARNYSQLARGYSAFELRERLGWIASDLEALAKAKQEGHDE